MPRRADESRKLVQVRRETQAVGTLCPSMEVPCIREALSTILSVCLALETSRESPHLIQAKHASKTISAH